MVVVFLLDDVIMCVRVFRICGVLFFWFCFIFGLLFFICDILWRDISKMVVIIKVIEVIILMIRVVKKKCVMILNEDLIVIVESSVLYIVDSIVGYFILKI